MKVLNFGSLNLDYVVPWVESILILGDTGISGEQTDLCGGKGPNQSIALAKADSCAIMPD